MITQVLIIWKNVIPIIQKAKEKNKQRRNVQPTYFKVGDEVLLKYELAKPMDLK